MTIAEIEALLAAQFPAARGAGAITELGADRVTLRATYRSELARPGGTIMGPALMTLADTAMFVLVLAARGPGSLGAFTTSLDIHFLRPPPPRDLDATAVMLKLGKRLAIGTVTLCSTGDPTPVAHATVTYALPVA